MASAGIEFTTAEIQELIQESEGVMTQSLDYSTFKELILLKNGSKLIEDTPLSGFLEIRAH